MKKVGCLVLVFMMICVGLFGFSASGADGQKLTVSYSTSKDNLQGAVFYLYRIGDVSGTNVIPTDAYKEYSVSYDISDAEKMTTLAVTLSAYILRDDIVADFTDTTDVNGIADFDGAAIPKGVYILMADKHRQNETTYFCEPSIVVLPYGDEERVAVKPKFEAVPDDTETISVSYKVLKSWVEDKGYIRPVEIEAELLRDGEIYDTVILNESNNWRHQWDNLSVFYHWTVTEKHVVGGYVVSLSQYEKTLLLTNSGGGPGEEETTAAQDTTSSQDTTLPEDTTSKDDVTTPVDTTASADTTSPDGVTEPSTTVPQEEEPELPVTGTLRWPIPYLALIGVFLFIVGYVKYRKSEMMYE